VDLALIHFNQKKTWTDQNVINGKSFNSKINGLVVIIVELRITKVYLASSILQGMVTEGNHASTRGATDYFGSSSLL
jgi:hypothetical protein